jgi:hypothetical protein
MEISADSPASAFIEFTQHMVKAKREYALQVKYPMGDESPALDLAFDHIYPNKSGRHAGQEKTWRVWLVDTIFPSDLYCDAGGSLTKMLEDERMSPRPGMHSYASYVSVLGRVARKREGLKEGFLAYTLRRWRDKNHRSMPHYYFDTESPEWVWHDLIENPTLLRSWRGNVSCTMNVSFRWNAITEEAMFFLIMKHCNWSHAYGDVFGANRIIKAFCKELGLEKGSVVINMVSCTMDVSKQAKDFLEEVGFGE